MEKELTELLTTLCNDIFFGKTDQYHCDLIAEFMTKHNLDKSKLEY